MGRGARRLVCFAFRVLHPGEIVHGWARWAASLVSVPLKASHVTATWATSLVSLSAVAAVAS